MNGRGIIRIAALAASCLLFLTACVTMRAAVSVTTDWRGTVGFSDGALFPPAPEELEEQQNTLNNSGFVAETEEGGGVLMDNSTDNDVSDKATITSRHEELKNNGILSYMKYTGSLCPILNDLIVVLDFSSFYITRFGANFLASMMHVLLGSSSLGSTISFDEDITVYDDQGNASLGSLHLGGLSRSGDTYVTVDGKRTDVEKYSLRIILPDLAEHKITFDSLSLYFIFAQSYGGAPTNIAIDISNMSMRGDDSGIELSPTATGEYANNMCKDFHFIGRTRRQLEYALTDALDYANTVTADGYRTEIFIREQEGNFTRLYAGIETAVRGSGANITRTPTVGIYDSVYHAAPQPEDILAVIDLFRWLKFVHTDDLHDNLSFRHYHRNEKNEIAGTYGEVTCDSDGSVDVGGETRYYVSCTHGEGKDPTDDNIVGYFTANGVYDSAGNRLWSADDPLARTK